VTIWVVESAVDCMLMEVNWLNVPLVVVVVIEVGMALVINMVLEVMMRSLFLMSDGRHVNLGVHVRILLEKLVMSRFVVLVIS